MARILKFQGSNIALEVRFQGCVNCNYIPLCCDVSDPQIFQSKTIYNV